MSNKPRPVGPKAKGYLVEADMDLAAAYKILCDLIEDPQLLIIDRMLIASRAQNRISEARRMLTEVLALKE